MGYGVICAKERSLGYDGLFDDRNAGDLLWTGVAFGQLVPEADRCTSVSDREEKDMIVLGIIVLLLGGYLVYALAHPDRF